MAGNSESSKAKAVKVVKCDSDKSMQEQSRVIITFIAILGDSIMEKIIIPKRFL